MCVVYEKKPVCEIFHILAYFKGVMEDQNGVKTEKYDRQLRLWASNGQGNIENCHICLIGVTTTNTELLKNLILPGCGEFTIIDHDLSKDLSHNFFWSEDSSILDNLRDLNPGVKGHFIEKPIDNLIDDENLSFWQQFSIVIMDDSILSYEHEKTLIDTLWEAGIPIVKNVSYGFYGMTRVIVKEHSIIETHPESLVDLRVENPWPELEEYVDSIDLDSLDEVDHAHIPYVIILIKLLKNWKLAHDHQCPSQKNRADFKRLIEQLSRSPNEINFQEAIQFSHRATNPPVLKLCVADIIETSPDPDLSTPLFWIYTKALQNFMNKNGGQLPLSGVLPDMASDTLSYVKLQQLYKSKFNRDRDAFLEEVRALISNIGRPDEEASQELANTFCKNSRFIAVQTGSKDHLSEKVLTEMKSNHFQLNYFRIYLAFLSVERLKKGNSALREFAVDNNLLLLTEALEFIFKEHSIDLELFDQEFHDILKEFARTGGTELHNIASLMGGIGSQEALKFITGQYLPIDNMVIFDGIVSHTETIKL